jgi:hypothetical protein
MGHPEKLPSPKEQKTTVLCRDSGRQSKEGADGIDSIEQYGIADEKPRTYRTGPRYSCSNRRDPEQKRSHQPLFGV